MIRRLHCNSGHGQPRFNHADAYFKQGFFTDLCTAWGAQECCLQISAWLAFWMHLIELIMFSLSCLWIPSLHSAALFVLVVQRPRTSCSLELQYIGNLRSYINGVRQGGVLSPPYILTSFSLGCRGLVSVVILVVTRLVHWSMPMM